MEEPNYIAREIGSSGPAIRYDECVKRVPAAKEILARILVLAVPEFRGYAYEDAIAAISGKPEVGTKNVTPAPEVVIETKNESKIPGEGIISFDIVFAAYTKDEKRKKVIINVEAQNSSYPGYTISSRGTVYCARIISEELDKEYTTSTYDDVKKAYSIWICMNPPKSHSNVAIPEGCIVRYDPVPTVIHSQGDPKDIAFGVYDFWSVIIITLVADPQKTDNELIGMLSTLLSKTTDAQTKMQKLATEYGIPLTRETSEEVVSMCNLSEGLIEDAIEQVRDMYADKLAQKDAALSEKDAALSEKDARIAELEKQNSGLLTKGKISTILELIASGIITLQQGAAQLSISEAKMVAAKQ